MTRGEEVLLSITILAALVVVIDQWRLTRRAKAQLAELMLLGSSRCSICGARPYEPCDPGLHS